MRFKCKSEFKSDFIENSKKGCQKQYTYNIEESSEEEKTTTIKSTTGNDGDLDVDEEDTYRRRNEGKIFNFTYNCLFFRKSYINKKNYFQAGN